jgi:Ran GTPase-activating protein (RanGAP) involved in mRNA processing and transport
MLPPHIKRVDLRDNNLGKRPKHELMKILSAFPATVIHLDLRRNSLDELSGLGLMNVLSVLSPFLLTLNLSGNRLGNKTGADLGKIFSRLPCKLKTLDLSWNDLHHNTAFELTAAFSLLPSHLISLNLNNNSLYLLKSFDQSTEYALPLFPPKITTLSLASNGFGFKKPADLMKDFSMMSQSIKTIDLQHNNFGLMSPAELKDTLSALRIHSVNLQHNMLFEEKKSACSKDDCLSALPKHICFNLRYNGETDATRAMLPFITLVKNTTSFSFELMHHCLSYLNPKIKPLTVIAQYNKYMQKALKKDCATRI